MTLRCRDSQVKKWLKKGEKNKRLGTTALEASLCLTQGQQIMLMLINITTNIFCIPLLTYLSVIPLLCHSYQLLSLVSLIIQWWYHLDSPIWRASLWCGETYHTKDIFINAIIILILSLINNSVSSLQIISLLQMISIYRGHVRSRMRYASHECGGSTLTALLNTVES